jgi:hypothetical protein
MVIDLFHGALWPSLLAQQPAQPVLQRLDPPQRAAVIMAILALVLTGLMLVAAVMLGAHWVRRLARQGPRAGKRTNGSSVTKENQRLRESLQIAAPEAGTGSTVQIDRAATETKIEGNTDRPAS